MEPVVKNECLSEEKADLLLEEVAAARDVAGAIFVSHENAWQ